MNFFFCEWAPRNGARAPNFLLEEPKGLPENFLRQQPRVLNVQCYAQFQWSVRKYTMENLLSHFKESFKCLYFMQSFLQNCL